MGNEETRDLAPVDEGRPELDEGMLPGVHDPAKESYDEDDWLRDLPD